MAIAHEMSSVEFVVADDIARGDRKCVKYAFL